MCVLKSHAQPILNVHLIFQQLNVLVLNVPIVQSSVIAQGWQMITQNVYQVNVPVPLTRIVLPLIQENQNAHQEFVFKLYAQIQV